jgi:hypothetical protein
VLPAVVPSITKESSISSPLIPDNKIVSIETISTSENIAGDTIATKLPGRLD